MELFTIFGTISGLVVIRIKQHSLPHRVDAMLGKIRVIHGQTKYLVHSSVYSLQEEYVRREGTVNIFIGYLGFITSTTPTSVCLVVHPFVKAALIHGRLFRSR